MLKPITNITISQQGEGRNLILFFDFVNSWEFANNWEDLSAQGKCTLPKNVYAIDEKTGRKLSLFGLNKNIGGFTDGALLKRGDKIKIEAYYIWFDKNLDANSTEKITIVDGYITKVSSKMPIEFEFEDNMYLLKQTPMINRAFKGTESIESILNEALKVTNESFGTDFKCSTTSQTLINWTNSLLIAENETIATFLAKLKKDAFVFSYFKNNELRIGRIIYVESEAKTATFEFQNNIIESELEYKRKDDMVLSAVAQNHITETVGVTKKGTPKTKNKRLEVLVTLKGDKVISKVVGQHDKPDPNTEGERRTFHFLDATTNEQLIEMATAELKRYYYSGFKGKFTTFGTPHVNFGDNAQLINPILPEQNGTYKIKGVTWSGGVDGYRQVIELDYKLNI